MKHGLQCMLTHYYHFQVGEVFLEKCMVGNYKSFKTALNLANIFSHLFKKFTATLQWLFTAGTEEARISNLV